MPQSKTFKRGSIIYFEGECKNKFTYLLKSGICQRERINLETLLPQRTRIIEGEFFGIKAALGVTVRDETISVVQDSLVYIFTPQEFEALISKNINIIFKMLKNFSNELRHVHYGIEKMIGKTDSSLGSVSQSMFEAAKSYFEAGLYNYAHYGFEAFLREYPGDANVSAAKNFMNQCQDILAGKASNAEELNMESLDSIDGSSSSTQSNSPFRLLEEEDSYSEEPTTAPYVALYNKAASLYADAKFKEALPIIENFITQSADKTKTEKVFEKAFLMYPRLLYYSGNHTKSIEQSKNFIKSFPGNEYSPWALVCIGECYLATGSTDNATAVFKKLLSSKITPDLHEKISGKLGNFSGE